MYRSSLLRAFTAVLFLAYTNIAGATLYKWDSSGTDFGWTFAVSVTADVTLGDADTNTVGNITAWSAEWTDTFDSYALNEITGSIAPGSNWTFDTSFALTNPTFMYLTSIAAPSSPPAAQFNHQLAAFFPPSQQFEANWSEGVAVPVPATLALFGLGLAGLGWSRRKKA